jgi:hypothetical protein
MLPYLRNEHTNKINSQPALTFFSLLVHKPFCIAHLAGVSATPWMCPKKWISLRPYSLSNHVEHYLVTTAMFKKGRCRKCSCSRAAHSRGTLTHYANLPLILFSLLNLEGQKIAGCNNCQKGETAGIYLETGNAIAVMSWLW